MKQIASLSISLDKPFGVIIPAKTGIIFTNQSGGVACRHPELEGVFIPLPFGKGGLANDLVEAALDLPVKRLTQSPKCRCDKPKFPCSDNHSCDSMEAWQWVEFMEDYTDMNGFYEDGRCTVKKGTVGVLVYSNSD